MYPFFFAFLELTYFFHIMMFSLSTLTFANQKIEYSKKKTFTLIGAENGKSTWGGIICAVSVEWQEKK